MAEKTTKEKSKVESVPAKINSPLVFISHDTRDSEIAEKFGNLLKSASAGALKYFHSSAKKPTQGIEYGSEWYPAIMEKIDEATDVVCLLAQNSVDRPWILYEAGVAKGKLNTKVIGIALGIPLSNAIKGPFAQFQNLDDDLASLTKLVLELVKKVPGLDPDEQVVKTLIETFKKEVAEIISKNSQTKAVAKKENVDDTSVAKLFEEVKIMFQDLPSRIENRIDPSSKKRRRFHPGMFEEMMYITKISNDPNLGFLMMLGFLRESAPWMYEVGIETYRELKKAKTIQQKQEIVSSFEKTLEMMRHPIMREFSDKSEDMFMLNNEMRHFLERYLRRYLDEERAGNKK